MSGITRILKPWVSASETQVPGVFINVEIRAVTEKPACKRAHTRCRVTRAIRKCAISGRAAGVVKFAEIAS
jgi:hypothetical protein